MSTFLAEWGIAILIAILVLIVLSIAEWRDHRDGIYDDEGYPDDGVPDIYTYEPYDPDAHDWLNRYDAYADDH